MIQRVFQTFRDRGQRARFVARYFRRYLRKGVRVLDVGCDNNVLKKVLKSAEVVGIDIMGQPDFVVDLEKEGLKRFKDGSFDVLVCTEVLEHVDNFHKMVDELFRVSNRYVIISLPNCINLWTKINFVFFNKIGKYYGLPLSKPEDRHKWLFHWRDIDRFFAHYAQTHSYRIAEQFLNYNFSNTPRGRLVRLLTRLLGLDTAQSYWILIEKPHQKR